MAHLASYFGAINPEFRDNQTTTMGAGAPKAPKKLSPFIHVYIWITTQSIAEGSSEVQTGKCYMTHLANYFGVVNLEFHANWTTTTGAGASKVLKCSLLYTCTFGSPLGAQQRGPNQETQYGTLDNYFGVVDLKFCADRTTTRGAGASKVLKMLSFCTCVCLDHHLEHSCRVQWGPNQETLYGAISQLF